MVDEWTNRPRKADRSVDAATTRIVISREILVALGLLSIAPGGHGRMRFITGMAFIGGISGALVACSDGVGMQGEALKGGNLGEHIDRYADEHGVFANYSTEGHIDQSNPFFQSLGTNGRACATCHRPENGFGINTDTINEIFDTTDGLDPLFAPVDGTNTPTADVSTVDARRAASSLLLTRGVIRIGMPVPANAEFTVIKIQDPYGFATPQNMSLYRRPLMATNLAFLQPGGIMWDGREPSLASQANNATIGHAQGAPLTTAQKNSIVDFETHLYTAQVNAAGVGELISAGGGPIALSTQPFAPNENAVNLKPQLPNTPVVFTLFSTWDGSPDPNKAAVLRGQDLFNHRAMGAVGPNRPRTCSTCHSAFNVGGNDHNGLPGQPSAMFDQLNSAGGGFLENPAVAPQFLAPDLPVYTLQNKTTKALFHVNDPGRAMITGKWADVGRFKTPALRGLVSHAPYFHNGLAKTLMDVVNFYDIVFGQPNNQPFTDQEKADLVAFLATL